MLQRDPRSHKGDNGRVAILGGSRRFHGAPILAALSAEASGVDLVYPIVPTCHEDVTKSASYGFIVQTFDGKYPTIDDAKRMVSFLENIDVCVIGPGLEPEDGMGLQHIIHSAPCALVLDAGVLQQDILGNLSHDYPVILTPHRGELERLMDTPDAELLAKETGAFVLLKGPEDVTVAPDGKTETMKGGNAGLTKGGTGDALAGLIGGLIAQKVDPFSACVTAAKVIKTCGEKLQKDKGFAYKTVEIIEMIPKILHCLNR